MSAPRPMKGILTYHSVDDTGSVISVSPDTFARQMDWLAESGTPVLPLAELLSPTCTTGVALTFDDAFQNFADVAWPIMKVHQLPATVYVPSDWVGRDNGWDADDTRIPLLPLMGWDVLTELAADGLDLGGHTLSHPRLETLAGDSLTREIEQDRVRIGSETGRAPTSFAYPYGTYVPATVSAVRQAGYASAVTTEMRLLGDTIAPLELPRLDAFYFRDGDVLEQWGTERFRRFVRFRAGARRVRRVLQRVRLVS